MVDADTRNAIPYDVKVRNANNSMAPRGAIPIALYGITSSGDMEFVEGPTGPAGPAGPRGEKGDMGATGAHGTRGPAGIQGEVGPKGDQGERGPVGDVTEVVGPRGEPGEAGPQGVQGIQGAAGPQGDAGPKGDRGERGLTGLQGESGVRGLQGLQGEAGRDGERGPVGDTGAAGPIGPKGEKGDLGSTGPKGDQGIQGAQGNPGVQGPAGASLDRITVRTTVTKTAPTDHDIGTFRIRFIPGSANVVVLTAFAQTGSKLIDYGAITTSEIENANANRTGKDVTITTTTGRSVVRNGAFATFMFRDATSGECWAGTILGVSPGDNNLASTVVAVFDRIV